VARVERLLREARRLAIDLEVDRDTITEALVRGGRLPARQPPSRPAVGHLPAAAVSSRAPRPGGPRRSGGLESGPPASQLAVFPGTTHFFGLAKTELVLGAVLSFLDAPLPEGRP